MKSKIFSLILAVAFLISTVGISFGASPRKIPSYDFSGRTITNPDSSIIVLIGRVGASKYTTLREINSSAGYQVTASKTLKVLGVEAYDTAGIGGSFQVVYGDNDVGIDTTAVPTNIVRPGNDASYQEYPVGINSSANPADMRSFKGPSLDVVAAKFIAVQEKSGAAVNIQIKLFAIEE